MKAKEERSSRLKGILTIAAITAGVYLGLRYLLPLIFPFTVAYFLAWIIRPVTEQLYQRLKIPRIIGGTFSLLLLIGVFGTAIVLLVKILIKEAFELMKNIPVYINIIADKIDSICSYWDGYMGYDGGTIRSAVDENLTQGFNKLNSNIVPKLTQHTISIIFKLSVFIGILLIIVVAAVLIVKDLPEFHKRYENNNLYKDIHKVTTKLSQAGIAYLRTQLIIMVFVALVCVFSLILLKNDYAVMLGIGIAFMDALPVLGIAIVLVPWSIIMLVDGNIYAAAILMTTFLICQVIREVLEPKLIGNRIGIKPLFTLVAMYIGVKLFSISGFFLGPIGLVIIITIYNTIRDKSEGVAKEEDIIYNKE